MLALPAEMAEGFLKRLHMYVLRSKVTFEVVDPAPAMLIAVGEEGAKTLSALGLEMPAHGVCIEKNGFTLLGIEPSQTVPGFCAGGARALVILPAGKTAADFGLTPAPAAWALASSIAAGIPQVLPPTRQFFQGLLPRSGSCFPPAASRRNEPSCRRRHSFRRSGRSGRRSRLR